MCFLNGREFPLKSLIRLVDYRNKYNKDYEVFSISNKNGFVPQNVQFDGNEIASKDKTRYKIVLKDQFAYNPARINVGSIAYLKKDIGQVSPMYITFETVNISNILLNEYFHSFFFKNEMKKHLEGSVRQVLSFENLQTFKISLSSSSAEFANAINCLNLKIDVIETKLKKLILLKKHLLNNMFI